MALFTRLTSTFLSCAHDRPKPRWEVGLSRGLVGSWSPLFPTIRRNRPKSHPAKNGIAQFCTGERCWELMHWAICTGCMCTIGWLLVSLAPRADGSSLVPWGPAVAPPRPPSPGCSPATASLPILTHRSPPLPHTHSMRITNFFFLIVLLQNISHGYVYHMGMCITWVSPKCGGGNANVFSLALLPLSNPFL